jgi:hypothetical protein
VLFPSYISLVRAMRKIGQMYKRNHKNAIICPETAFN